jgi:hypothetical protein
VSSETTPIKQVLDLAVFGPLGLALAARDALPDWVAKGRTRAAEQFTLAKGVGELVTDYGQQKVKHTLVGLGILPGPPPPPPSHPTAPAPGPAPTPATAAAVVSPPPPAPSSNGRSPASVAPQLDRNDLAIPGYDSLSASQVVSRLDGLAPGELEAVRAYEAGSRGRRTILTKISQLQSGRS